MYELFVEGIMYLAAAVCPYVRYVGAGVLKITVNNTASPVLKTYMNCES